MDKRFPVLAVLVVVLVASLGIPSVEAAHTAQNLTITTGTGSAWVTGGYNFAKTAKATKSGFKPFAAKSAITIDIWIKCQYHTGVQYVVSVYVSSVDNVKIFFSGATIYFDVATNGVISSAQRANTLVNGSVYHITGAWDKSSNGGKADLFVNGSKTTAATGTGAFNTGSNDDLWISGADGSTNLWKGILYTCAIYYEKHTYTQVNTTGIARDIVLSSVDYYWSCNEGSGTTLLDWDDAWWLAESWSLDVVTKSLTWYSVENWTLSLLTLTEYWHIVNRWAIDILVHSIIPTPLHDSWFFVLIFAFLGAVVCFAILAMKIKDGDLDGIAYPLIFGLILLLVVVGVIVT